MKAMSAWGAGVTLRSDSGAHGVAAASGIASRRVEELQITLGEGPCVDVFTSRRPVLEPDVADSIRWPVYSAAVQAEGVRAVFALPLQIGAARLGILDIYRDVPGRLLPDELATALTFASAATNVLLNGQEQSPPGTAADGLEEVLEYRMEVHQAQGMIMVQVNVSLSEASALLRAYAFAHGLSPSEVGRAVVHRRLRFDDGPEHGR